MKKLISFALTVLLVFLTGCAAKTYAPESAVDFSLAEQYMGQSFATVCEATGISEDGWYADPDFLGRGVFVHPEPVVYEGYEMTHYIQCGPYNDLDDALWDVGYYYYSETEDDGLIEAAKKIKAELVAQYGKPSTSEPHTVVTETDDVGNVILTTKWADLDSLESFEGGMWRAEEWWTLDENHEIVLRVEKNGAHGGYRLIVQSKVGFHVRENVHQ